ncbi:MAG: AAA family ATPase [Planctomycetaceae bacterium]|nr:AAA family ATPase [Planctomycetaceae bacterium]
MITINFYSYKGGAGRTVLMSQIARCLAALGKKVVIADFDFDAPGTPAAFKKSFKDIKGGIYDLINGIVDGPDAFESFTDCDPTDTCRFEEFKKRLNDYLIDVEIKLNGNRQSRGEGEGFIKLLPSGYVNPAYWNNISDISWLQILSSKGKGSFIDFVIDALKPALKEMGIDYLIIDSRAGITYYGTIAHSVAEVNTMIVCPNVEAEHALETFLIPAFLNVESTEKRTVFIVSRMPSELAKDRDKTFQNMVELMRREMPTRFYTQMKKLKLHSDIETHFNPSIRVMDERFLLPVNERPFVVRLHEDILIILAALCPELLSEGQTDLSLEKQAHTLWEEIYGYPFRITREERIFRLFDDTGEMRNIDDEQRNVAFKVDTFLNLLRDFRKTLEDELKDLNEAKRMMERALSNAGKQCGASFGASLDEQLIEKEKIGKNEYQRKIQSWCEFDTRAGFGLMSYDGNFIEIKNPFIQDPEYMAFITGYVIGVLEKLLYPDMPDTIENYIVEDGIKYKVKV